jgi:hypothetical protein
VNSEQDCHRPPDASAATGIDLGEAKALGARRREFDPAPRRCLPNCTSKLFTARNTVGCAPQLFRRAESRFRHDCVEALQLIPQLFLPW